MIRLCFFFLTSLLSATFLHAQINFSRYVDEGTVPVFDIDRHLEVKFEWTMGGQVQMHMNEGLNYLEEGSLDLAMGNLNNVLKVDSTFWPAYYYRGVVLTKQRKLKEALKVFENAVHIDPKRPEAYVELGRIYERMSNYKKAKSFYAKALEMKPGFVPGQFGLATMELFLGEPRKASRLYEDCIEMDSSYAEAYVVLSIMKFRDRKKNKESIALLDAALKANPKYTYSYFWRGYFHVEMEAYEKCLADWTSW
jgi:tetratricopeptide (TPR) repeat protein